MNRIIKINQEAIERAGLSDKTDLADWAIVDYLLDWHYAKRKRVIKINNEKFIRVNFNYLMECMPLMHIKDKDAISKRFKKLRELELIKTYRAPENTLYVTLTAKCMNILISRRKSGQDVSPDMPYILPDKQEQYSEEYLEQEQQYADPPVPQITPDVTDNPEFYTPESPLHDSLPYTAAVRRIIDYWNSRLSAELSKCEPNYEIYVCISFQMCMSNYRENDYYLAIDRYLFLQRAGQIKPKTLKEVVLAIKRLLNI
ncbi:MAG: hypothetical protein M0Z64_11675 [Nitrospiraceae bacterium]|nr:hypothetical protein [Nitrospiraceae bacterium]